MKKILISLVLMWFGVMILSAQKLTVGYIYPAGGQNGTTEEIELGGLNLQNATAVIVSGKGVKGEIVRDMNASSKEKKARRQKLNDQSSPQLADRIKVQITIESNAMPGLRDLRLQSPQGVSNKLYFEVGQFPNVLENGISSLQKPNEVKALPATLCGQIMPGEIDYFAFQATKGMDLVVSVKGRTLVPYIADAVPGWFQPVIRLTDEKGKEVAYDDDYRNNVDPVIITKIPRDGRYILSITDAIYRGREDFDYRIQIGEIPFVKAVYPTVGLMKKKIKLKVDGVNLSQDEISYKPVAAGYNECVVKGKGVIYSNPVSFYALDKGSVLKYEPVGDKTIGENENVYGHILETYQPQTYIIPAARNSSLALELIGRRNGSLLDGVMRLYSPSGKLVVQSDDVEDPTQGLMTYHADPVIQYKTLEEGNYTLEVEDLFGHSGEDYYYLICRRKQIVPFQAFVTPANLTIPKGGTASFRIDINRDNKIAGPMEISVEGVPKNYLISSLAIPRGAKSWDISITAPMNASEGSIPLKVIVSSQLRGRGGNQETVTQTALAADNMMQAFYYIHHIPAASFAAEIMPAAPFSIELGKKVMESKDRIISFHATDSTISIPVHIRRNSDFKDPVELSLSFKSKMFTLDPIVMGENESDRVITIKLNKQLVSARRFLTVPMNIVGTVKGEIQQKGKRTFQNAKYREMSPGFVLEKEMN